MHGPNPMLPRKGAYKLAATLAGILTLCVSLSLPASAAQQASKTQTSSISKPKNTSATKNASQSARKPTPKATPKAATIRAAKGASAAPAFSRARPVAGLKLESAAIIVVDENTGMPMLEKNANKARPVASITKLMTAMVILDAKQSLNERIQIVGADVDRVKYSSSRLAVGTTLTRKQMLKLALMSSENRAAHSLGRTYPGGMPAFIKAMNRKARALGMKTARFVDPTGLDARNVASPADLALLVSAAADYPAIREYSTAGQAQVAVARAKQTYHNTNPLTQQSNWDIEVSKTGYIQEAGRCLVMQAVINGRPTLIVLMDGQRNASRVLDSLAVRRWLEKHDQKRTLKAADLLFNDIV